MLMKLDREITYRPSAYPACLPSQKFNIESNTKDSVCIISGWGSTEGEGDNKILQHATIPVRVSTDKKFSDEITVVKYSCEIVYSCLYGYAAEIFFNLHVFNLFVK